MAVASVRFWETIVLTLENPSESLSDSSTTLENSPNRQVVRAPSLWTVWLRNMSWMDTLLRVSGNYCKCR